MAAGDEADRAPTAQKDRRSAPDALPKPELNPMMNPVLGENLGRWAEVYFTNPPEKREEAVQELLRELESPPGRRPPAQRPAGDQNQNPAETEAPSEAPQEALEALVCPACLHKNKSNQRFCGLCGYPLRAPDRSEAEHGRDALAPLPVPRPIERDANDWQWLHERTRAGLAQAQKRQRGKYLVAAAALLVVAAGSYFVLRMRPQPSRSKPPAQVVAVPSAAQPASKPEVQPVSPGISEQTTGRESQGTGAESSSKMRLPAEDAPRSSRPPELGQGTPLPTAANERAHPDLPASSSETEGGQPELALARRYLDGEGVPRDPSLAVDWLWKAVSKQNVEAALLLSDLYAHGVGAPRSCDQARVLLTAAAKKGSAEARQRLNGLDSSCR